jgi:PhnB protein
MAPAKKPIPEGHYTVTPHMIMNDAAKAIEWYKQAFGATEVARAPGPDGKIMHAEIRIGNSLIMLNDAMAGGKSAKDIGGSPISLWLYVEDCDTLYTRAVKAGAIVPDGPMGQLADQFWGDRCGTLNDPFGYTWTIATRKEDLTTDEISKRMDAFLKQMGGQVPTHQ